MHRTRRRLESLYRYSYQDSQIMERLLIGIRILYLQSHVDGMVLYPLSCLHGVLNDSALAYVLTLYGLFAHDHEVLQANELPFKPSIWAHWEPEPLSFPHWSGFTVNGPAWTVVYWPHVDVGAVRAGVNAASNERSDRVNEAIVFVDCFSRILWTDLRKPFHSRMLYDARKMIWIAIHFYGMQASRLYTHLVLDVGSA